MRTIAGCADAKRQRIDWLSSECFNSIRREPLGVGKVKIMHSQGRRKHGRCAPPPIDTRSRYYDLQSSQVHAVVARRRLSISFVPEPWSRLRIRWCAVSSAAALPRQRPRGCRASEQRDELAAFRCQVSLVLPTKDSTVLLRCGISQRRPARVLRRASSKSPATQGGSRP